MKKRSLMVLIVTIILIIIGMKLKDGSFIPHMSSKTNTNKVSEFKLQDYSRELQSFSYKGKVTPIKNKQGALKNAKEIFMDVYGKGFDKTLDSFNISYDSSN